MLDRVPGPVAAAAWCSGPVMWAMRVRPAASRCSTASTAPPRSSETTEVSAGLVDGESA